MTMHFDAFLELFDNGPARRHTLQCSGIALVASREMPAPPGYLPSSRRSPACIVQNQCRIPCLGFWTAT